VLQNAGLAATQAKKTTHTPARKSLASGRRRSTPRPAITWMATISRSAGRPSQRLARRAAAWWWWTPLPARPHHGQPEAGSQDRFTPCSTIKLVAGLAALSEHIVDRDTSVFTGRHVAYTLTTAIARSNNQYFNILARDWASSASRATRRCSG